jgi:hypothetical protein
MPCAAHRAEVSRSAYVRAAITATLDGSWTDRKVAVEVDGGEWTYGRHQRPGGFRSDAEKMSLAAVLGWRVLRVTGSMVEDGSGVELVRQALGSYPSDPPGGISPINPDAGSGSARE